MLQFNIPDKQYILFLDNLDLNLLSQYVQTKKDEKKKIWSQRKDKETAYYKVELVSEDLNDDDPCIEPYESYMCYICNIDVPQKFYKQHNRSKIHQNCKKLAEKFLENVTKQMNIEIASTYNHTENNTFYCETCCKVIGLKNKRKHMSSYHHEKYTELEKLTCQFLDTYINNNKNDVDIHIKFENDYEDMVDSNSSVVSSVSDRDIWNNFEDVERRSSTNNISCHSVDNHYSVDMPARTKDMFPGTKLKQRNTQEWRNTEKFVRNTTQCVDNNNGFFYDNASISTNASISQKICQESMSTNNNTHKVVRNYEPPFSYCESENDCYSAESPSFYENTNVEIVEQKLTEYLKQFVQLSATQLKCLLCSVPVPYFDRNIIEHVEGFTHKDNTAILLRNHYIEKVSVSQYLCYLCDLYTNDFVKHINRNVKHKKESGKGVINKRLLREYVYNDPTNEFSIPNHCREQYYKELKRNKIITTGKSSFYCNVCHIKLSRVSEIDHMFGERHRDALDNL